MADLQPDTADTAGPGSAPAQPMSRSEAGNWYSSGPVAADAGSDHPGYDSAAEANEAAQAGNGAPSDSKAPGDEGGAGGEQAEGKSANLLQDALDAKAAVERVYKDFEPGDGFSFDDAGKKSVAGVRKTLNKLIDTLRSGKDGDYQGAHDDILRMGVDAVKAERARAEQNQRDVWSKLNDSWKEETRRDPEIGGNRLDQSLQTARSVVEEYGGNEKDRKAFMDYLGITGGGNHPLLLKMLVRIGKANSTYEDFSVGGRAPSRPQKGQPGSGRANWYPNSTDAGQG
jgi:hypothetical protein